MSVCYECCVVRQRFLHRADLLFGGVLPCVICLEASMRPWPARDCYAMGGGGSSSLFFGTVKDFKIYNSYYILHLTECRLNSLAGLPFQMLRKGSSVFIYRPLMFSHRRDLEQLPFMYEAELTQGHNMIEIPGFARYRSSDQSRAQHVICQSNLRSCKSRQHTYFLYVLFKKKLQFSIVLSNHSVL